MWFYSSNTPVLQYSITPATFVLDEHTRKNIIAFGAVDHENLANCGDGQKSRDREKG